MDSLANCTCSVRETGLRRSRRKRRKRNTARCQRCLRSSQVWTNTNQQPTTRNCRRGSTKWRPSTLRSRCTNTSTLSWMLCCRRVCWRLPRTSQQTRSVNWVCSSSTINANDNYVLVLNTASHISQMLRGGRDEEDTKWHTLQLWHTTHRQGLPVQHRHLSPQRWLIVYQSIVQLKAQGSTPSEQRQEKSTVSTWSDGSYVSRRVYGWGLEEVHSGDSVPGWQKVQASAGTPTRLDLTETREWVVNDRRTHEFESNNWSQQILHLN